MLIIPVLRVQRQVNPWSLMFIQPSLIRQSQVKERPCLKKQGRWLPRLISDLSKHIERHTCMHACTQAGMQTGNYCERA